MGKWGRGNSWAFALWFSVPKMNSSRVQARVQPDVAGKGDYEGGGKVEGQGRQPAHRGPCLSG